MPFFISATSACKHLKMGAQISELERRNSLTDMPVAAPGNSFKNDPLTEELLDPRRTDEVLPR